MGVTQEDVGLLMALRERGVSFERTLTIGRQQRRPHAAGVLAAAEAAGTSLSSGDAERIAGGDRYIEPLLRHLGAQECHSIDASDYEGATFVHDKNEPLPAELERRYSRVYDGGSIEHICNVAQTLKNYMSA